jgi:predicted Zn-dependent protease
LAFWTRTKPVYDRSSTYEAAEKARSRGRVRKAIAEYQKILAVDPSDPQVNARLAPLLVKVKRHGEAATAFETSAAAFIEKGFSDKALAVYVHAADHFPLDDRLWLRISELAVARGRKADGVKALQKGAAQLVRRRTHLARGIVLLERAMQLEPAHPEVTIGLARALRRDGRKREGLAQLDALAAQLAGPARKRVLLARFWLSPNPAALWRWLRG